MKNKIIKAFEAVNLWFWRWDGVFSLLSAVFSFLCLMQCTLAVQNDITALACPALLCLFTCFLSLSRFCDWLLKKSRKTRYKAVTKSVNTILKTWRMEKQNDEKQNEE